MSRASAIDLIVATTAATLYALVSVVAFAASTRLRSGRRATVLLGWAMAQHTVDAVLGSGPIMRALGGPVPWSIWASNLLAYFVPVPWAMLVEELIGPGWKGSVRRTWQVYLGSAIAAVCVDVAAGRPGTAQGVMRLVIAAGALVGFLNVFRGAGTFPMRVLRIGILVFMAFVVHDGLAGAGLLPWRTNTGPAGVLICVAAIAFTVVARTLRSQGNLRALEHEMTMARRIQEALLPDAAPRLEGAAIGFRYLPAAAVAGDIFQFLAPTPRSIGVLVADVSGHGVPAALIASMVKVAAAAQQPHADEPAQVLAGIHLALAQELPRGHFVTANYVHLDLDRGVLRHASAGHPPALIYHDADRTVTVAGSTGPLLIAFAPASYPVSDVPIAAGDRIVLYTDGVIEAMRADEEMFGLDRLSALVAGARHGPQALARDILAAVTTFAGKRDAALDDDCTLVAIEIARVPQASPARL